MMFNSKNYLKDLDYQLKKIDLERIKDKRILITGANGLICSYIVDILIYANIYYNTNITIIAMGRSKEKIRERFSYYYDNELFIPIIQDVCEPFNCNNIDYIIHGASNANPKLYITDPVGTMNANYLGILNMLNLAKRNKCKILYISSSDIYGFIDNFDNDLNENEYGYIDILNVRSSYSSSKRASETLCASFYSQYDVNVVIVRPAHIYGPTFSANDSRAVSDFIKKASNGENILMKSDGSSTRSYCYVGDAICGIFKVLFDGIPGNAYNISNNKNIISIKELAELICKYTNTKLKIEIPQNELDKKIDSNVKVIKISSKKIESLGWKTDMNISDGIKLTLSIIKEIKN